jgi:hypothetical protein
LQENAGCGISVRGEGGALMQALLLPEDHCLSIVINAEEKLRLPLPQDFLAQAFHLFRVEVNGRRARVQVDQGALQWEGQLPDEACTVALVTRRASAAFAGFALTVGWQDLFEDPPGSAELPARRPPGEDRLEGDKTLPTSSQAGNCAPPGGWQVETGDWSISGGLMQQHDQQTDALIVKPLPTDSFELVFNARLTRVGGTHAGYGVWFSSGDRTANLSATIRRIGDHWTLVAERAGLIQTFALPDHFDPGEFRQFRFRKAGNALQLSLALQPLGEVECESGITLLGLVCRQAAAAFDMVRVTALTRRE